VEDPEKRQVNQEGEGRDEGRARSSRQEQQLQHHLLLERAYAALFSDEPPGLGLGAAQGGSGQRVAQHGGPKRSQGKHAAVEALGAWGARQLSAVGGGGGGG
jgi:hypothetical protein